MTPPQRPHHPPAAPAWALALAGAVALAVAMGIGRFAFTPLLPLMMREGLLDAGDGALLAVANYAGYLAGALSAASLAQRPARLLRWALPAIALCTAAAAWLPGMPAWLAWRFAAGACSAWVLVAATSWSLGALALQGRAAAGAWVFSGVGFGITLAGALAWALADAGSAVLWQVLGAAALLLSVAVVRWLPSDRLPGRGACANAATPTAHAANAIATRALPAGSGALVICYGSFGFGYILPATFLPTLARALIDDPRVFGLVWPAFGLAAAASTLLAARAQVRWPLQRIWACCQAAMALGTLLPLLSRSGAAITAAALLVGGSFMVATMAGLQLARALAPQQPAALVGRMTAAFALGQIAGPLAVRLLDALLGGRGLRGWSSIELTTAFAGVLLGVTAAWLWRHESGAAPMPAPTSR